MGTEVAQHDRTNALWMVLGKSPEVAVAGAKRTGENRKVGVRFSGFPRLVPASHVILASYIKC